LQKSGELLCYRNGLWIFFYFIVKKYLWCQVPFFSCFQGVTRALDPFAKTLTLI